MDVGCERKKGARREEHGRKMRDVRKVVDGRGVSEDVEKG